jgi:hypothetical protein
MWQTWLPSPKIVLGTSLTGRNPQKLLVLPPNTLLEGMVAKILLKKQFFLEPWTYWSIGGKLLS